MHRPAIVVIAIALALPASASAAAKVTVTPKKPIVDQGVTVHISSSVKLPSGDVFRVIVNALDGNLNDGFSHLAVVNSRGHSVFVTPEDDPLGGTEWQQGSAFVSVFEVKRGAGPSVTGRQIADVSFRFYGLP